MERQRHGFDYENYIISSESLIRNENYTHKWDAHDKFLDKPVSIKCISIKGSVDFGDFRRQTNVENDFILYIGFWSGSKSNIIESYKILINVDKWKSYFGNKTIITEMMSEMSEISNDKSDDIKWKEFRKKYGELYGESIISLRFKRDHKKQKRIQCGISQTNFKKILEDNTILWKK